MTPHLLTEAEFHETLTAHMIDIKGREDVVQPEGVIDPTPYMAAIPVAHLGGLSLLPDTPPAAAYRSQDGRFDHMLYPCNRSNVYLVVIIALDPARVHGHYVLDLDKGVRTRGGGRLTCA